MAKASGRQMEYAKHIANVLDKELPETEDKYVIGAFIAKNKEAAAIRQEEMNQTVYAQIRDEIKIVDVAKEMGMTLTRKGSYLSTAEYDSIRIKADENIYFRNSRGTRGTVIDFVMEFTGKDKNTVIQELSQRIHGDYIPMVHGRRMEESLQKNPREFILPEKSQSMRNAFAYLTITRKLDPEVVQNLVHDKLIYQDVRKNCVFVSYSDSRPVFATTVGTNTFLAYKGDIVGCDYSHGWYVDNNAERLHVTESPIDAISKMSILKAAHEDYTSYDYLAMTGTGKYNSVFSHLKRGKYKEVHIGTDNDEAGIKCIENIKAGIREQFPDVKVVVDQPVIEKDWNEELKYLFAKGYRYDNYINPSEQLKSILQDEVAAILQEDNFMEEFWKKGLNNMGYPNELQDYVYDYLDKNRDNVLSDINSGSQRSVGNIINNYNKKTKISMGTNKNVELQNVHSRNKLIDQGIEL